MIILLTLMKALLIILLIPGSIPAIIFGLGLFIKKYIDETECEIMV